MTKKSNLETWIVGVSAAVIVAAVVAGFAAVGGPGSARAHRIDELRLAAMNEIATAAQCAYSVTGAAPASLQEIETALAALRTSEGPCQGATFDADRERRVSYQADDPDHINLCAEFLRPSPSAANAEINGPREGPLYFSELHEPREAAGRHCYRVRLARQTAEASPAP